MNQPSPIKRRVSRQIQVGNVPIGGDAPIAVQSMTNTETCDVEATVAQIHAIAAAGADLVRVLWWARVHCVLLLAVCPVY